MNPRDFDRITRIGTSIGDVWCIKDAQHLGVIKEVITHDTYGLEQLAASGFEPKVIVDLGANIGTFTLMASHYFPKAVIYAFEPNAGHFHFLSLNCSHKATIMRSAVLGYPKTIQVSSQEEVYWRKTPGTAISVAVMRNIVGYPDLVKIDVEQSEINILPDMRENHMIDGIKWIIGEWHFQRARTVVADTLSSTHNVSFGPADKGFPWDLFKAIHK